MAKDAFDLWHEWANKPADSNLSISSEIHGAVTTLDPDERNDRETVNAVVRAGIQPYAKIDWKYEFPDGKRMKVFATEEEGRAWLTENDPDGVLWKTWHGPRQPARRQIKG